MDMKNKELIDFLVILFLSSFLAIFLSFTLHFILY